MFVCAPFITVGPLTHISPSWFGPRMSPVSGSIIWEQYNWASIKRPPSGYRQSGRSIEVRQRRRSKIKNGGGAECFCPPLPLPPISNKRWPPSFFVRRRQHFSLFQASGWWSKACSPWYNLNAWIRQTTFKTPRMLQCCRQQKLHRITSYRGGGEGESG